MKKRLLCFAVLLLAVAVGFGWYETREEDTRDPYVLYFLEADLQAASGSSALRTESARLPAAGDETDTAQLAELLVQDLLDGPRDETLKRVTPVGTTLLSLKVEGTRALVDLSSAYGTLSGVALTLADQAIALTLTQLPDILSVRITVRGRELAYRDKQVFTARDVLLAPEGDVVSTVDVTLYFLDEKQDLVPEERTLELYEGDTQVSAVVRAVENGPSGKKLSPVIPEGFRTKSAWLEENVCYVNLSSGLLDTVKGDIGLEAALQALAKSLCSLDSVQEVRYMVDGEFTKYYGQADVSRSFSE